MDNCVSYGLNTVFFHVRANSDAYYKSSLFKPAASVANPDKELSTLLGIVLTEKCDIRNMSVTELVGMGRSPYTGFSNQTRW